MTYADSSFFVSFYLTDAHSVSVEKLISQDPELWITPLHQVEISNAIWQNVQRGFLKEAIAQIVWRDIEDDCLNGTWHSVPVPENIWQRCIHLQQKHGKSNFFRTLDSLHIACALELGAEQFWSFDKRQLQLAELCGLKTNP